jgi:POT family proton-dependent oligopeptide transporter
MKHPLGLYLILFTEFWERFSYYGMRSLLIIYMTRELSFSTHAAGTIYGLYTGLAYLTPVVGGYLADRYMGQQKAIVWGGVLIALGHLMMAFGELPFFYAALCLLVLGTGFFKANTAVLVGALYAHDDPRRDDGFSLFYLFINIGGLFAPLVCGTLVGRGHWHLGFGAAGIGMVLGLAVFMRYRSVLGEHGLSVRAPAAEQALAATQTKLTRVEWHRILALVILALAGNVTLWAAISQTGSSMALFADRETNLAIPGLAWSLPASYLQAIGPLFIIMGVPAFTLVWRALSRRQREPNTPQKFILGLMFVAGGFAVLAYAGSQVDDGLKVSMGWLILASLLHTCGELCVSPVGLSLVTRLSPARYASGLMGLWYASLALANGVGGELAAHYDNLTKTQLFVIPAAALSCSAIILMFLTRPLVRLMHGIR